VVDAVASPVAVDVEVVDEATSVVPVEELADMLADASVVAVDVGVSVVFVFPANAGPVNASDSSNKAITIALMNTLI